MEIKFYWQTGKIEFVDGVSVLNANDVLWHKLRVQLEPAFTSSQRLFVLFLNEKAGDHTHEIFASDNGTVGVLDIPAEVIRVAGNWTLQLFARMYSATGAYTQKGSDIVSFTIEDGLILDNENSPVNNASIANLYAAVLENADGAAKSAEQAEAYMQALATNQPNNSEAGFVGEPTVSIEQADDGRFRFKFANLKGEQGQQGIQGIQGEKGEKGDKGDGIYLTDALCMVDDVGVDDNGRCYICVPSIEKLYVGQRLNFSDTDDVLIAFDGNIPIATITEINTEKGYYGYTVYLDVNIEDNIPIGGYIYNAIPDAACRLFSKKVDKNTDKNPQAYGVNGAGLQHVWGIGSSDAYLKDSTLAMYRSSAQLNFGVADPKHSLVSTNPTQPYHTVPKIYADEVAKKYRHDITFICRSTSNNTYDIEARCDVSLYSSVSTAFTRVSEILTATKTTGLHIPVCCDGVLYEKGFTEPVGVAWGNVYLNLDSSWCYIYGVLLLDLPTIETLNVILYSSVSDGDVIITDTVVEI